MRHFITYLNFAIITITITLMGCADTTTVTQTNTSTANNQSNSRGQSLVVKTEKGKAAEYILGEYIVVFNEQGVGLPSKQAAQQAIEKTQEIFQKYQIHRDSLIFQYQHLLKGFAVKLSRGQLRKLKNDPRVDHISKNYLFKLNVPVSISRDKELSKSEPLLMSSSQTTPWGVLRVHGPFDGTGKTAWILDSGIDLNHGDLNVDAQNSVSFIPGETAEDQMGHGTYVGGILAAKNNSQDLVGVAAGAEVVAVKVCTFGGCPESSILEGLEYVYNHAAPEDIINMSLGGPADADLDNAVIKAANAGLRFVIAAGNDKAYAGNGSPARVDHPNVWTVSAYRQGDEFAKNFDCGSDCNDGSNYGNPPVDFSGPGEDVPSLRIGGGSGMGFIPNTIGDEDGTSYSAPHIAGLLLAAPSVITTDGYVSNDPDGDPDPIAVVPYLGVSISGPTQLDTGETGTWYANVSDGVPPYSYAWYYKPSGATTWSKVGSNSSYSQGTGNGETDYQLKLEVTDETSRSSIDDHFVVVGTTVEPPCYSLVSASEDSLETTSNDSLETNRIPPPDC